MTPGHAMPMPAPAAAPEGLAPREEQLRTLRVLQASLRPAFEQELRELRAHDAEAQRLMDTDPRGHVEHMRMPQEHKALVRELPRQLLRRQAALFEEIVHVRTRAGPRELPEPGVAMAGHFRMERWTQVVLLPLGVWLVASPSSLAYGSAALAWSDVLGGLAVIALAALALAGRTWAPYVNAVVGLWVMFAPLVFWAPTAAGYSNDTLVGILIITFALLVPMRMPAPGRVIPLGWTYSPSTWLQRAPVIALAFLSFFLARYMAAYQLEHVDWAFDPFFGDGTVRILTSDVSRAFPVSDAGLGAYVYLIEILSGFMGDAARWRTMPWMVALFGFAVVPLGVISVILIILQPLAVGAWCTFCLLSALLMLVMVALSLDEIVAMFQFLGQTGRAGGSVWRAFWVGGNVPLRPVEDVGLTRRETGGWREMVWGVTVPWTLLVSTLVGAWLMAAPAALGSAAPAAHADHLLGALVVVVAVTATAEVGRPLRFLNVLVGAAIAVAPWLLPGAPLAARLGDLVAGILVIGLSLPRGAVRQSYGGWNPFTI